MAEGEAINNNRDNVEENLPDTQEMRVLDLKTELEHATEFEHIYNVLKAHGFGDVAEHVIEVKEEIDILKQESNPKDLKQTIKNILSDNILFKGVHGKKGHHINSYALIDKDNPGNNDISEILRNKLKELIEKEL